MAQPLPDKGVAGTDPGGRKLIFGGGVIAGMSLMGTAAAQSRTDTEPRELRGQPVPEPPADRSAGPVRPGRGSMLTGKVAVVTGAARGTQQFGEYNVTVNAILPGLVDTALTRYEKRLTESMGETGQKPSGSPRRNRLGTPALLPCR